MHVAKGYIYFFVNMFRTRSQTTQNLSVSDLLSIFFDAFLSFKCNSIYDNIAESSIMRFYTIDMSAVPYVSWNES